MATAAFSVLQDILMKDFFPLHKLYFPKLILSCFIWSPFSMLEPFHKNPVILRLFRGANILIESSSDGSYLPILNFTVGRWGQGTFLAKVFPLIWSVFQGKVFQSEK